MNVCMYMSAGNKNYSSLSTNLHSLQVKWKLTTAKWASERVSALKVRESNFYCVQNSLTLFAKFTYYANEFNAFVRCTNRKVQIVAESAQLFEKYLCSTRSTFVILWYQSTKRAFVLPSFILFSVWNYVCIYFNVSN